MSKPMPKFTWEYYVLALVVLIVRHRGVFDYFNQFEILGAYLFDLLLVYVFFLIYKQIIKDKNKEEKQNE